jgi:hypothetical protein
LNQQFKFYKIPQVKKVDAAFLAVALVALSSCSRILRWHGNASEAPAQAAPKPASKPTPPAPAPNPIVSLTPLQEAFGRSCQKDDVPGFAMKKLTARYPNKTQAQFDALYAGQIKTVAAAIIPISSTRALDADDVLPKEYWGKMGSVGEVLANIVLMPVNAFLSPLKSVKLSLNVDDYIFEIDGALGSAPSIKVPDRLLYLDKYKKVKWHHEVRISNWGIPDFNCQLAAETVDLCKTAIDYKLYQLNAVSRTDLHGAETGQFDCLKDLLVTTQKMLTVRGADDAAPMTIEPALRAQEVR